LPDPSSAAREWLAIVSLFVDENRPEQKGDKQNIVDCLMARRSTFHFRLTNDIKRHFGAERLPEGARICKPERKTMWTVPRRLRRPPLLRPPKSPRAPPPVPPGPASLHSRGGAGPGGRLTSAPRWAGGGDACSGGPPLSRSMHRINDGLRSYRSQEPGRTPPPAAADAEGPLRLPDAASLPRHRPRGSLSDDPARSRWAA
jgi:hypothetical protein